MRLCIPIRAKNIPEVKKQVKKALKHADIIEIWLDFIWQESDRPSLSEVMLGLDAVPKQGRPKQSVRSKSASFKVLKNLFKYCGVPVIAVCRSGNEKKRIEILKRAILCGAKFVDIDIQTDKKSIKELKNVCRKYGAKLIISKHIWDKTPELPVLLGIFKNAKKLGADIVKIAAQAANWSDNAVLFEFVSRVSSKSGKIIAVGMGERGKISRIGCPLLGSYLTYVALDEKSRTADGQLTVKEFLCLFK